jgi:hypothetical protein
MVVGVLRVTFGIEGAYSLKDKRGVIRRLTDRVRNKFNVAVAEVGEHDTFNRAVIGVSCVANDGPFVNSVLDKVLDAFERIGVGEADILDTELELIHW